MRKSGKPQIYGESVRGASHARSRTPCQDACGYLCLEGGVRIAALSDGHGSASCPYSHAGAVLAVGVFCELLSSLAVSYGENEEGLLHFLRQEGELQLAKQIQREWQERVRKLHRAYRRPYPRETSAEGAEALMRLYGCTLLGVGFLPGFGFAFQIGDGDIVRSDGAGATKILPVPKSIGVETDSLCQKDAWNRAYSLVFPLAPEGEGELITLTSDGFANSYASEEHFLETCREYEQSIREYGFAAVCGNLRAWLEETTQGGCGDDVTMVLCYRAQEPENPLPAQKGSENRHDD